MESSPSCFQVKTFRLFSGLLRTEIPELFGMHFHVLRGRFWRLPCDQTVCSGWAITSRCSREKWHSKRSDQSALIRLGAVSYSLYNSETQAVWRINHITTKCFRWWNDMKDWKTKVILKYARNLKQSVSVTRTIEFRGLIRQNICELKNVLIKKKFFKNPY